ncbi:MAG: hypothetical protein K2X53_06025, partial [Alphaproteobacteria bacterium]|nr:hypothetical protein [Alphaproteobacteria bacterium]
QVEDDGSGQSGKPATSGASLQDTTNAVKKSVTVNPNVATAVGNWIAKFIRWETTIDPSAPKATSRLAFLKSKKFVAAAGVAVFAVGAYWYDPETTISYGKYILTPILGSYFGVDVPGVVANPGSVSDSGVTADL